MKTIFRSTNLLLLLAAIIAFGAVAGMAQDPCADAEGIDKMQTEFDVLYKDKVDLNVRQKAIDSGKSFLEKYGNCPADPAKTRADWLKGRVPKMESDLKVAREAAAENALIGRFVNALTAKNFDETFAAGKEALSKYPDKYRSFSIVLGSIGFDEAYKGNAKYSDDGIRFAKSAIADIEAGKEFTLFDKTNKPFTSYGFGAYSYKTKEDALGFMNLTIGYIMNVTQKNKVGSLPYLNKVTLGTNDASKNPIAYDLIGDYYIGQLDKVIDEILTLAKGQDKPNITEDELNQIKANLDVKNAMSNGTAVRALDAFSRAYTFGNVKAYKDAIYTKLRGVYQVRFGKDATGLDTWILDTMKKPMPNPQSAIEPISDPKPVAPVTTPATTPVTAPATTGKPPVTTQPKPGTSAPAKPAATPVKNPAKPQATVKKKTTKKKTV